MKQGIQKLDRTIERLSKSGLFLSNISMLLIMFLVTIDVITRSIFNLSITVAAEYSGYLLIAILFFGGAYSFRENVFIRVSIIYEQLTSKIKYWVDIVLYCITLTYMFILLKQLSSFMLMAFIYDQRSVFISETPLTIPYSFMVIGTVLLSLEIIISLTKTVIRKSE